MKVMHIKHNALFSEGHVQLSVISKTFLNKTVRNKISMHYLVLEQEMKLSRVLFFEYKEMFESFILLKFSDKTPSIASID